jgi:hypothetical protein
MYLVTSKGGKVYLLGKVKYTENGVAKEKVIDEISNKTLMDKLGDTGFATTWQKYIYPKDFFGLPKNAVIKEIGVSFTNQNKSIVVLDNSTDDDFLVEETCE